MIGQDRRVAPGEQTAYDFSFTKLATDAPLPLGAFEGCALLVVNVASACGYTSQYRELEQLWQAKKDKGLVVIGVPCNDFGGQERSEEGAIRDFCQDQYHVTFPMTGKVEIAGADRHPFYAWIADLLGEAALPRWNFHKYLIDRTGALVDGFPGAVVPLGPRLLTPIEQTLAAGHSTSSV